MNPALIAVLSLSGLGAGILGLSEGFPLIAGGGFTITVSLQLWTTVQLGPIKERLARMEERQIASDERQSRMEEQVTGRRRPSGHKTPSPFE